MFFLKGFERSVIGEKFKSKNARPILYLMGANLITLPIILFSNVIVARYLGVTEYGDYTFLVSLLALFTTIFTLGFYQAGGRAIVLSYSKKRVKQFYGAELLLTFFLTSVLSVFLALYFYFDENIKQKGLEDYLGILIFFGWTFFLRRYFDVLFQSDKKIKLLALSKFLQPLFFLFFIIFISFFDSQGEKLLVAALDSQGEKLLVAVLDLMENKLLVAVLGLFFSNVISSLFIVFKLKVSFKSALKRVKEIWLYNKSFGLHLYIGGVFPLAFASMAGVMISYTGNDNSGVGFYALAYSLSSVIALIPNVVATVHYKDFSKQKRIPVDIIFKTVLLSLTVLLLLLLLISPFVRFAYGESFLNVVDLVFIMAFGFFARGMGDFLNKYLGANGYGKLLRNGAILTGLVLFCSSVVMIPIFKEYGAAVSSLLGSLTYLGVMVFFYRKVAIKKLRN